MSNASNEHSASRKLVQAHTSSPETEKACVFCKKFEGRQEGSVNIFEPLNPVVPGHMMVVPFKHVTDFMDDPKTTALVMADAALYAKRKGGQWNLITSAGKDATQTVFHFHVHLVPRTEADGLLLPWSLQTNAITSTQASAVRQAQLAVVEEALKHKQKMHPCDTEYECIEAVPVESLAGIREGFGLAYLDPERSPEPKHQDGCA